MVNFTTLSDVGIFMAAVVAFFGSLGCIATLLLIYDMNRWNGYMRLIFNLTSCQLLADIAFFFFSYNLKENNSDVFPAQLFFFTIGSVSVALWTNLISCALFLVVVHKQNFNFLKNFNRTIAIIMFPGTALAILFVIYGHQYYKEIQGTVIWIQIASVIFNLAVHAIVTKVLHDMAQKERTISQQSVDHEPRNTISSTSTKYNASLYSPIRELAERLKYYPVVQIVCMLGLIWFFFSYILNLGVGPQDDATLKLISWYSYSILSPAGGIGYFIVFLKVQPYAYNRLILRLRLFCRLPVDRTMSAHSDAYRISGIVSLRDSDGDAMTVTTSFATEPRATLTTIGGGMSSISLAGSMRFSDINCHAMDEDMLLERIRDALLPSFGSPSTSENPMQRKADAAGLEL